jgi:hypothetical protein
MFSTLHPHATAPIPLSPHPYITHPPQVLVATALLGAGFTLASLQLTGVYARLMGARLEDVGTKMTWFFAVVCLARCLGTVNGGMGGRRWDSGMGPR